MLCLVSMCGCSNTSKESKEDMLKRILDEDNYVILDVRTEEEYEEGHVVGSMNIPYDEIDATIDIDKDKTVLVYCRSGRRSAIALEMLTDLGFEVMDLGAFDDLDLEKE